MSEEVMSEEVLNEEVLSDERTSFGEKTTSSKAWKSLEKRLKFV